MSNTDELPDRVTLHDSRTGEVIRTATPEELKESIDVAELDGIGTLTIDGRDVYVRE